MVDRFYFPFLKPLPALSCIILFLSFLLIPAPTDAQRYLQVEKRHMKIKLRYTPGDEITFRLRQSDQWISTTINAIDYENNLVYVTGLTVALDSIAAVKSYKPMIPPAVGGTLWRSGLAGFLSSALYGIVFRPDNTRQFLIFFGTVTLSGFGLKQLSKKRRVYTIGDKYNLRLTDLNFYIAQPGS